MPSRRASTNFELFHRSLLRAGERERPLHGSLSHSDIGSIGPSPLIDFRLVDTVLISIVLALDLHVPQFLFGVSAGHLEARHAIDDVDRQAETVDLVLNG